MCGWASRRQLFFFWLLALSSYITPHGGVLCWRSANGERRSHFERRGGEEGGGLERNEEARVVGYVVVARGYEVPVESAKSRARTLALNNSQHEETGVKRGIGGGGGGSF